MSIAGVLVCGWAQSYISDEPPDRARFHELRSGVFEYLEGQEAEGRGPVEWGWNAGYVTKLTRRARRRVVAHPRAAAYSDR